MHSLAFLLLAPHCRRCDRSRVTVRLDSHGSHCRAPSRRFAYCDRTALSLARRDGCTTLMSRKRKLPRFGAQVPVPATLTSTIKP